MELFGQNSGLPDAEYVFAQTVSQAITDYVMARGITPDSSNVNLFSHDMTTFCINIIKTTEELRNG